MDYYKREQLPILQISEGEETVPWEAIREPLEAHPANILFLETGGKLSGIVSQGDLKRARERGDTSVSVSRHFTSLTRTQYAQARDIFHSRENIREIPVVDPDGRLEGMCTASDDLLYLEYWNPWSSNRYTEAFLKSLKAAYFVRPPRDDLRRIRIKDQWISAFQSYGTECREIDLSQLASLPGNDPEWILLPDQEMKEAALILLQILTSKKDTALRLITYREAERAMTSMGYGELIKKMLDVGITIYNLYASVSEHTEGRRRITEGFRDWMRQPKAQPGYYYVLPSQAKEFYGEYYTPEYAEMVGKHCNQIVQSPVYCRLKDCEEPYFHVTNGERLTVGQPEEACQTIWFFGPCLMIGTYVEDKHTIESYLQGMLNLEDGRPVRVVNCGCNETAYQEIVHILSSSVKPGDIVVMFLDNQVYPGTHPVDLMELYDAWNIPCAWLMDNPLHCNHRVNELIARELLNRMKADGVLRRNGEPDPGNGSLLDSSHAMKALYLDTCLYDFHYQEGMRIGEVSMHGNPFTRGHRYLIETSSKKVDRLFVFLVEDETGYYSFAERYAMAVDGTRDLKNVRVVPSGPFQGTRNVIAAYFIHSEQAAIEESAQAAARTYAESIALPLHITYCFLGEEPTNPQTRYFAELKKKFIAPYGIQGITIPRLEAGGNPISASTARKALLENDLDTLKATLPETTIQRIIGDF